MNEAVGAMAVGALGASVVERIFSRKRPRPDALEAGPLLEEIDQAMLDRQEAWDRFVCASLSGGHDAMTAMTSADAVIAARDARMAAEESDFGGEGPAEVDHIP